MLDYFRACRGLDRAQAFTMTFGRSVAQLETEALRALRDRE